MRLVALLALLAGLLGVTTVPATAAPGGCAASDLTVVVGDTVLCSHGNDPRPGHRAPSYRDDSPRGDVPAEPVPSAAPQCLGDGRTGQRVQVLDVRPFGGRGLASVDDVRRWVGQVEWTFTQSAARDGGRRHVRWATEPTPEGGCVLQVTTVVVPATALARFEDTVAHLAASGFDRADRKYLLFASYVGDICGIGTAPRDDQPGDANRANTQVGYARVDTPCWTTGDDGFYSVAAHELAHTLGAVQDSAPHANGAGHCTDEWDLMCYDDSTASVTVVCVDDRSDTSGAGDLNNRLLDCRNDDYFDAGPTASGYLASHWNVASSLFLGLEPGTSSGGRDTSPQTVAGRHRPTVRNGAGFDSCTLPVVVAATADIGSPIAPLVPGEAPADLAAAVDDAVARVNRAVGREVVVTGDADRARREGIIVGPTTALDPHTTPTTVAVATDDHHIRTARVEIATEHARPSLEVWVQQALIQALGVARTGVSADLMAFWPTSRADRTGTGDALRHLYGPDACAADHRLDDTVLGHPTQRQQTGGSRSRVALAPTARTAVDVGVDVASWLRSRNGDRWADRAIVCRDDVHADCLAGSALAGGHGPVLFVPGGPAGHLPDAVRRELTTSLRPGGSIHVLGGPDAVSTDVESSLRAVADARVDRIQGNTRYATATAVAAAVLADRSGDTEPGTAPPRPVAIVARGDDPVDAVAAGAYAARRRVPVVLTEPTRLPLVTRDWLAGRTGTTVTIGGPVAVSDDVVAQLQAGSGRAVRVAGADRFATSVAIAEAAPLWNRPALGAGRATIIGLNAEHPLAWSLALAAAPVAAQLDGPTLYTRTRDIPDSVTSHIRDLALSAAPDLTTIYIGERGFGTATIATAWHDTALPGFDGNIDVSAVP